MTASSQARIAAHTSWAKTADRSARTAPAHRGLADKFLREARERLGPDATDRQVADAAESARTAHYLAMSAKGHAAKRAKRGLAETPDGPGPTGETA